MINQPINIAQVGFCYKVTTNIDLNIQFGKQTLKKDGLILSVNRSVVPTIPSQQVGSSLVIKHSLICNLGGQFS